MKRNFIILALLIIFFCFMDLHAQNVEITGQLCDSIDKAPLNLAKVILRNVENDILVYSTITNFSGNFKIQNVRKGKYTVHLNYIGYNIKKIQVLVNDVDIKLGKILLTQCSYKIDEVTVTYKPILDFNDENVTLNIERLGDVENLSVAEAIEMVPGAYFDFEGKFHYLGYSDFTTLIDGEKTGTSFLVETVSGEQEYIKLKTIPAKFIKAVEIFPAPLGKYGYFTPIINIIPKGDLSDFYIANCDVGRYNKYKLGFGVIKKKKKFKIAPSVQYNYLEESQKQIETRNYSSGKSNSYSKGTFSESATSIGNISLSTSYRFNTTHLLNFTLNNIYSDKTNHYLKQIEYNDGNSMSILEKANILPDNEQYSLNYRNLINLGGKQKLMVNIDGSLTNNSSKGNQTYINQDTNTEESKYKLCNKNKEKSANIKFNYHNYGRKINYSFLGNFPISLSTSYSVRKLYNENVETWKELFIYSGNNKYFNALPNLTFNVFRKSEGKSAKISSIHYLEATVTEQFRYEKMNNLLKNKEEIEKVFTTNFGLSYRKLFNTYGNYSASYNGNIRMPGNKEKTATPAYIDETTIRTGNSDLKPELTHRFHIGYLWSSSEIIVFSKGNKNPKAGYSLNLDYSLSANKIIQNYREEDGIAIYSWTNKDSYQLFSVESSFDWRISPKAKFRGEADYNIDKYKGKSSTESWVLNSQFKFKFLKKISCNLKYGYNSPRDYYNRKVYTIHDASIIFSGSVLKNSVYLSLEATKLFSGLGNKMEVYGTSINSKNIVYPESCVLWVHASLKLFKFH